MSDQAAQPQKPRDAREEWEEWTRTASAEELADGIAVEWERDHHDPHVHNLAVSERTNAYLWLRLTERLERAATDLVDASNSGNTHHGPLDSCLRCSYRHHRRSDDRRCRRNDILGPQEPRHIHRLAVRLLGRWHRGCDSRHGRPPLAE